MGGQLKSTSLLSQFRIVRFLSVFTAAKELGEGVSAEGINDAAANLAKSFEHEVLQLEREIGEQK